MLVEVLLEALVGIINTKLWKTIGIKAFKAINIQNACACVTAKLDTIYTNSCKISSSNIPIKELDFCDERVDFVNELAVFSKEVDVFEFPEDKEEKLLAMERRKPLACNCILEVAVVDLELFVSEFCIDS